MPGWRRVGWGGRWDRPDLTPAAYESDWLRRQALVLEQELEAIRARLGKLGDEASTD